MLKIGDVCKVPIGDFINIGIVISLKASSLYRERIEAKIRITNQNNTHSHWYYYTDKIVSMEIK